jgi:signal transduction histidine kinase
MYFKEANNLCKIIGLLLCCMPGFVFGFIQPSATHLNDDAYSYFKAGNYVKSYQLSIEAKQRSLVEKNNKQLARALSNMASNLSLIGNNENAINLYTESLTLAEKEDDSDGILRAVNNMAAIYDQVGNHQEVLAYHQRQYQVASEQANSIEKIHALIGLSQTHRNLEDLNEAQKYLYLAEDLLKQSPDDFSEIYINFAAYSILEAQQNWNQALIRLEHGLKLAKENNFVGLITSTMTNIAIVKFKLEQFDDAERLALDSLALALELQINTKVLETRQLLADIYQAKGDFKNALSQTKQLKLLELKLTGEKVKLLAEVTRIDRQVAETEKKLEQSNQRREIAELKYDNQQRNLIIILVATAFLLISFLFWSFRRSSRLEINRQKKVNQELLELDQLKDRILTNTSHELRTPLNGIIGLSDIILLSGEDELSDTIKEQIKLIGASGQQLSEIVDDILDLAQLRTHKMTFHCSDFDLNLLISEVIQLCKTSKVDSIEVKFGQRGQPLFIRQDKKRVRQILFNLIGNALKFTKEGFIAVNSNINDSFVEFSIQDSGIGIPKENLKRVFEGFEQVDIGDTRQFGGSGLGLAICREITTALGGSIHVSSELNIGTTMSVNLPAMKKTFSE